MAKHDVIVIGASAGGVEAISRIVADLPREIRASIFVVLHISRGRSMLPEILTRAGRLPASHPTDGEPLQYGRIYIAPPDQHMVVLDGAVRIVHTSSENGVRPAVDPLFRSAARAYGARVVAAILTGTLDDGTAGIAAVKEAGGVTIAQDPDEAFAPGMPRSAVAAGMIDHVLTLRDIPPLLSALAEADAPAALRHGPHVQAMEPDLADLQIARTARDRPGQPSVFTCPECHGTLWEVDQRGLLRFRCRVGHVYSPESMVAAQADEVDRALWVALRTLEERAALAHRLAERGRQRDQTWVDRAFTVRARQAEAEAAQVRLLLRSLAGALHSVPDDAAATEGPDDARIEEPAASHKGD
ncbi:MAG TPA: chemotaxis protein CheB [Vicinamibacterales bacterium]|jgi:two-component system chemotaxis response regulator CheB